MIVFVFLTIFFKFGFAIPISGGTDVGRCLIYCRKEVVVNDGKYPYVVYMEITETEENDKGELKDITSSCTGVILNNDAVLTAAHCVGKFPKKIVVIAGIVNLEKERKKAKKINGRSYVVHKDYVDDNLGKIFHPNDIAIVWLEKPLKYSKLISEAPLSKTYSNLAGWCGEVLGYGIDITGRYTEKLKRASQRVVEEETCMKIFPSKSSKTICVIGFDLMSGNNKGDSGGPLVIHNKVVGISSFGEGFTFKGRKNENITICDPRYPAVYTDVSQYNTWIEDQLKGKGIKYNL